MRHIVYVLLILPLFSVINTVHSTSQLVTDSAEALAPSSLPISEVRRERKERRLLRKKKQRMRELREEIRTLTWSLHQTNGGPVIGKTEMKHKQKGRHGRKGVKWRKNLLEKLKVIVRRLDRMERRIIGAKSILSPEFTTNTTTSTEPSSPSTVSVTTDATINLKIKRIQPAITRSRSGENGTVCVAHKDCRPGES
ncbi:hypothetical protein ANCCAN_14036 [Ancylostoma caninum]|uniref:Uncharacterized protein n=1 Tax=Ancylostoma caninum TaxID=29170 RepID=A0A368GB98_ANCCA|nr:hypothetical protein ANCCAN_14036 [Ancylostoma caninum]